MKAFTDNFIKIAGMAVSFLILSAVPGHAALLAPAKCGPIHPVIERQWPATDFSRCTVPFAEVRSGGPGKDGIRSIENPLFMPVSNSQLADNEPVITVEIGNEQRSYPLQILIWHEIVNDEIGGRAVAVTYCPLCNASIVFDRELNGQLLEFGTTGNLRKSDLVMYDRQTESWFQQFTGTGLFGQLAGETLTVIPARLEAVGDLRRRSPDALIMQQPTGFLRPYGANPYIGYDTSGFPFLFDGTLPAGIEPLEYVVIADDRAWALSSLKQQESITSGDITLKWQPGRASALDSRTIAEGRDLGSVTVLRRSDGTDRLIPYKVSFAFVWHAFNPGAPIIR